MEIASYTTYSNVFELLPNEVIEYILFFLFPEDINSLLDVNKQLREFCSSFQLKLSHTVWQSFGIADRYNLDFLLLQLKLHCNRNIRWLFRALHTPIHLNKKKVTTGWRTCANSWSEIGDFQNAKLHGAGIQLFRDQKQIYIGNFREGQKCGKGIYVWGDGQQYVGEYNRDLRNGSGVFTWPNGQKYVGQFKDDKKHGHGVFTCSSGRRFVFMNISAHEYRYEGEFNNDAKHGMGVYTWSNGYQFKGYFVNNTPVGSDVMHPDIRKAISQRVCTRTVTKNSNAYGQIYFNIRGQILCVSCRYLCAKYEQYDHVKESWSYGIYCRCPSCNTLSQ